MSDGSQTNSQIKNIVNDRFISIAGWMASLVALISTAVWCVAAIQSTTSNLQLEIKHLATEVSNLGASQSNIVERLTDHEIRVRMLEGARSENDKRVPGQ